MPDRRMKEGSGTALAGVGALLLMIVCCAGPALIAAGVLSGIGAWLASQWVIAAALPLAAGGLAVARWRRAARRGACCPPNEKPPWQEGTTER